METKLHSNRIFSLLIVLFMLAWSGNAAGAFQNPPPQSTPVPQEADLPVVVHLYYGDRDQLTTLAAQYDVWDVEPDQGYAVIKLFPEEYQALQELGYRMEVDEQRTLEARTPFSIPGFPCYRTVEETFATLDSLASTYPLLVEKIDIGNSWDKAMPGGAAGYDINVLRITNQAIDITKPRFFLMAEIHAREYTTAETATRFAEYLLSNYGTDPEITFFLDYNEVLILPMTNPDGRKQAEIGNLWRKNCDSDDGCSTPSLWGVDLNRNSSFKWGCCGGSSGDPCGEVYRGPSAGSEPEIDAVQNFVSAMFSDQRGPGDTDPAPADATGLLITLHSYAGTVQWPWGWTYGSAPNATQLEALGAKLASLNNYLPQQSSDLYITDGTTDDWSYGTLGIASFTYEMGNTFFESCSTFESTIWPDNLQSLLYAMKIPETPYMTVFGPDSTSAAASPSVTIKGEPVELTATVTDQQNGNQTVQAAEYYLTPLHDPTPPGDPGTGIPMTATDGSWSSAVEDATATLDTSTLEAGKYILAVRGQDAGGNWGPFTAAFLTIMDETNSGYITGSVLDACTRQPLPADIATGEYIAATNPANGSYIMHVLTGTYTVTASADGYGLGIASEVVVLPGNTTTVNFLLDPLEAVHVMDGEHGLLGWAAQTPWALSNEDSHSPTRAWSDSPYSNYNNQINKVLTSRTIDLTGRTGTTLTFWHKYDTEVNADFAYVEYSPTGLSPWTLVASFSGDQPLWARVTIPLPALDGSSTAKIRFRLQANNSIVGDGWHIDDITIAAAGDECLPMYYLPLVTK
jgi:hypothetical protein